jgi:hypothetical protein
MGLAGSVLMLTAVPARAQDSALPPVSVGAGVQTSYVHDAPENADSVDRFLLNSVRLYVNGSATKKIKFMFNTEYDGSGNHVTVLDAVAEVGISDKVNFWLGRMLPPSDRANLYGPYYSHHWAVYTDGIQDGYPFVATGRDNGFLYFGQFQKLRLEGGVYDGESATGSTDVLTAARGQYDFWDPEPGHYMNGTFYGEKNILAIGGAGQWQSGGGAGAKSAYTGDFLLERKVGAGGAISIESEFARYDKLGGYDPHYALSHGGYVLGAYLFPKMTGVTGQFEILGKFANAKFTEPVTPTDPDYTQKTTEVNFNYVIQQFKARAMVFYLQKNFSGVHANDKQFGVGLQVQM